MSVVEISIIFFGMIYILITCYFVYYKGKQSSEDLLIVSIFMIGYLVIYNAFCLIKLMTNEVYYEDFVPHFILFSILPSLMVLIGLQIFQLKKLKSDKQYRFSVLSTAIVLILTFFPFPMEKMYHYHLEQQRKEAVEVLLNAPEIKKLVVQGNPLKSQYVISYDLPEKYKHLSNGGEVTIKQNFIEFIEHGSGNFDFHYIIYSHNDNQPIVQYSTSEIEKVDPHWYSVHIVIENE